ncbi:ATP-binding domain-containing protein [Roseivirga echinicomitans]
MEEKIEDIAKSVKRHRDLEISISASNPAIGRSTAIFGDEDTVFWITNKENKGGFQPTKDITGSVVGTEIGNRTTIIEDGKPIYKNTKIGEILILNHEGRHKAKVPAGDIEIEIFNRASYNPSIYDGEYATDILIKISGDSKTHTFQNISKILSLQIEIEQERERLEHATDQEAQQLIQRIADKEAEMKTYLDKAQGFIRKYAELRYQPILDPIQESIKRTKIFDGSLIINGGPGTGKTTSLIQRIKFLISPSIEEYITLKQSQKDILFNQKTSWIFYSPNELLAQFLRNSMKMEELTADTERVKVWSLHKNELVKAYKIVDTTKRPFLIYNSQGKSPFISKGKSLFVNKPKNIQEIVSGLNKFFLDFQKDKLNKVSEIDVSRFKWKNTGLSIQKYLNDKRNVKNIDELIRLFLNLNETYKGESDIITEEYSANIKQVAGRIQVIIIKDLERASALSDLLNQWKNTSQDTEDDDDDDTEIELEDFEEKEDQTAFDFERELFTKLKSLCRKQALKKFDKNTKLSKRDRELLKLIPEVEQQNEYEQIGQTAFFKKFFERIIKGILANVLREIPMTYKKHRREQLTTKNKNWDLEILTELVKNDKNSRIHSDEQALLLHFTNSICFSLSKGFQRQFNSLNHPYLTAYKNHCKPVIGIDEATDFSIIDLLAINSFRHPQLSSVTLSGDIMQRITNDGLTSWEDFSNVVSGTERKDLEVSYRQSPTLLSLAQSIYEKSTGNKANYKSYIERDESEPKPLILISDDEDGKLNWIAERIIEIYKAYGDSIPSIAIFLPNENHLDGFANQLGNLDTLSDVGILVKACRNGEVLGDKNTVRIFSIDKIKGLEFEAVFFHNLDELQNQNLSNDLLLKYLYVGLSRATFYLGLTVSKELNNSLNFISNSSDKTGKTWRN